MAPTQRTRELETELAKIRHAGNTLLNYDMWDRQGAQHASAEERTRMETDAATATRERDAAKAALEQLVARARAESPADVAAWADAHDAYLAAFIAECAAKGEADGTAAKVAADERAGWREVRDGKRAFVDENVFYVTLNADRYRSLFGVDPG